VLERLKGLVVAPLRDNIVRGNGPKFAVWREQQHAAIFRLDFNLASNLFVDAAVLDRDVVQLELR
jgi:hypothetical protein